VVGEFGDGGVQDGGAAFFGLSAGAEARQPIFRGAVAADKRLHGFN
jgi:hypothetical protein